MDRDEWESFISATLLALRGWGGMVRQIEVRGDRVVHPVPRGSLVEFLAVRLLLDRLALAHTAREALGYDGPLAGLRDAIRADTGVPPGRRASSSGPSWSSSSPRSSGSRPTSSTG